MFPSWIDKVDGKNTGVFFGAYQLYRLVQFIVLLWATTRITMTPDRLAILRRIVDAVLVFVCMGIVLTFFEVLPKSLLVQHLPADPAVAGPWSFYRSFYEGEGWGTIGYNHAYVGAQVLLLTSLRIHLSEKHESLTNALLLFIMMLVIFMSGSRAGLAASMAFAAAILWRRPTHAIAITTIALTLIVLTISFSGTAADLFKSNPILDSTAERQMQLANPTGAESLSGRDEIWRDKIIWLNEDPTRWITGTGFGSHGHRSAHMLYLQIIAETGLIGLIVFVLLAFKVLYHLYHRERGVKPIFWATIALFFSATSQDTYYPVPQCGQFLGFYFVALVIALGAPDYHRTIGSNKSSASGVRI
jgi:O-antigen ligase